MKSLLTFIMALLCTVVTAQGINDVLRFGTDNTQGTARFQSMSGAFGALGGDLSATTINPAGAAVFNNTLLTISGTHYIKDNSARYFNSVNSEINHDIDINQVGGVMVFKSNGRDSGWQKIAIAANYDVVENYENQVFISGASNQGVDNYFLENANGTPFGNLLLQENENVADAYLNIGSDLGFLDQQAFLGFFGGIIDPTVDDNATTTYIRNAEYSSVNQRLLRTSSGFNSKFTLNVAGQYEDFLYIGAAINVQNIVFEKYDEFTETGYNSGSSIQSTEFDNLLQTEGSGYSANIGAIAKLNDMVRVGVSYQTPTWYRLTDDFSQRVFSDIADVDIEQIDFNLVNRYDPYTIITPSKLTGSLALIFGKNGLLSFDYDYQDMSQAKLKTTTDVDFSIPNEDISNQLGQVSTYRLGGEYRAGRISLRGGYKFKTSPFKNTTVGDLQGYSGGIGFSFGSSRLDLAVNQTKQDVNDFLFNTGLNTPALISHTNTNATLSYTINF